HFVAEREIDSARDLLKADALRHQRVALPMSDRSSVESWVGIGWKRTPIRIDMADLCVRFDDDGNLARREQEFHRVRLIHDGRQTRRQTVRGLTVRGWGRLILRERGIFRSELRPSLTNSATAPPCTASSSGSASRGSGALAILSSATC